MPRSLAITEIEKAANLRGVAERPDSQVVVAGGALEVEELETCPPVSATSGRTRGMSDRVPPVVAPALAGAPRANG